MAPAGGPCVFNCGSAPAYVRSMLYFTAANAFGCGCHTVCTPRFQARPGCLQHNPQSTNLMMPVRCARGSDPQLSAASLPPRAGAGARRPLAPAAAAGPSFSPGCPRCPAPAAAARSPLCSCSPSSSAGTGSCRREQPARQRLYAPLWNMDVAVWSAAAERRGAGTAAAVPPSPHGSRTVIAMHPLPTFNSCSEKQGRN
jgi:hypothetical protein